MIIYVAQSILRMRVCSTELLPKMGQSRSTVAHFTERGGKAGDLRIRHRESVGVRNPLFDLPHPFSPGHRRRSNQHGHGIELVEVRPRNPIKFNEW